jgi:hypothetical protein
MEIHMYIKKFYLKTIGFEIFVVSLTALSELIFFEHQENDLLRAKGVVILDTGHLFNVPPDGHTI